MNNLLAEDLIVAPEGGFKGFGRLGLENETPLAASFIFSNFISSAIGLITIIGIIWFVFLFITGAISYMSAGGDKAAIESARKKIINGVVGLVIIAFGLLIIKLVGTLIGLPDILNFNILFTKIAGGTN